MDRHYQKVYNYLICFISFFLDYKEDVEKPFTLSKLNIRTEEISYGPALPSNLSKQINSIIEISALEQFTELLTGI